MSHAKFWACSKLNTTRNGSRIFSWRVLRLILSSTKLIFRSFSKHFKDPFLLIFLHLLQCFEKMVKVPFLGSLWKFLKALRSFLKFSIYRRQRVGRLPDLNVTKQYQKGSGYRWMVIRIPTGPPNLTATEHNACLI